MNRADLYSNSSCMQTLDAEQVLSDYFDSISVLSKSNLNVVDLGCGCGRVTAQVILPKLPKDIRQLVGVDLSQEMVEHAIRTYTDPRMKFLQLDISQNSGDIWKIFCKKINENLTNGDKITSDNIRIILNDSKLLDDCSKITTTVCSEQKFDLAFSFYCLHWIPDQRTALNNIYQLMKPGGEALFVLLAQSPIFTLYHELSQVTCWKPYMKDFKKFTSPYHNSKDSLKDFEKNLLEIGFVLLKSECREKSYVFDNMETLEKSIKAVNPFLPRMPEDLQDKYMKDCLTKIEELSLTEVNNNAYPVQYQLLVAHVKKN